MRNTKVFLKQIPKAIVTVTQIEKSTTVTAYNPSIALSLLQELKIVRNTSTSPYDQLWKLRGLLNKRIMEQFETPEVDKTFAIEYLRRKISEKQKELKMPGSGAI